MASVQQKVRAHGAVLGTRLSLRCRSTPLPGAVQVDEVKTIMVDNIEKVLERGERLELLVDKTDNLRTQARL